MQTKQVILSCVPLLYEPGYESALSLVENWLEQPTQQRLIQTQNGRKKVELKLRKMVQNAQVTPYEEQTSAQEPVKETVIWRELKAELFELLLTMVGDVGITIYEINHAVQAALSVLQIKERQYRRLPKEALEKILDDFLPSAEGGRSLVRFIVNELSRLRGHDRYGMYSQPSRLAQTSESSEDMRQRAVKIIALTISELAQRQLVPIPSVSMLDDKEQPKSIATVEKDSNDVEKPVTTIEHKEEKSLVRNELVSFSDRVLHSFWKQSSRTKMQMSVTAGKREQLTISRELDRERREYNRDYGTRFNSSSRTFDSSGGVGALNVKLPFYRDPRTQVMALEEEMRTKEQDLKNRMKTLETLEQQWETDDTPHVKNLSSMMVSMNVLQFLKDQEKNEKLERKRQAKDVIETDQLQQVYEQLLHEKCSKYIDRNYQLLLGLKTNKKKKKDQFPSFFEKISELTAKDVELLLEELSTKSLQQKQVQMWSRMFLDALLEQNPDFTFEDFQTMISAQGPLHNLPPVLSLLETIEIENKDYLTNEEIEHEKIFKMYNMITKGFPRVESSSANSLISQIVDYVFSQDPLVQMERVEEYCLKNLLIYEQEDLQDGIGERFILDFIHSLRDTYQYEQYKPEIVDLPDQLLENQRKDMLREGAHQFLNMIMPLEEKIEHVRDQKQKQYESEIKKLGVRKESEEESEEKRLNELLLTMTPEEQQQVLLQKLNWEMRQVSSMRQFKRDAQVTKEKRSRLFNKEI
jgi:hypothetical protein